MTSDNHMYLDAVSSRIGRAILDFCAGVAGEEFHADDLRRHVTAAIGVCAPGSADRVLRHLRQKGALDYVVLNRKASLYRLIAIDSSWGLV